MKKLKIGFLYPYSGVYPCLKEDFQQGFDLALESAGLLQQVSAFPEFIHCGELARVKSALEKLLRFDRVHLVTGVVNNKVMLQCMHDLPLQTTPVILNNLGACIPQAALNHTGLFYNSLHLWKSQWVMGRWAQQQFGGQPSINFALYESGYNLHECFKLGTAAAGAELVSLNLLKPSIGEVDTTPLIEHIRAQQPAHAHVLLSGKEAVHFLRQFRVSGLADTVQLSVSPFMAERSLIEDMQLAENTYTACTWSHDTDTAANHDFVARYRHQYTEVPGVFSLLGYETGLAVASALQQGGMNELAAVLQTTALNGPRGEVRISTDPLIVTQPVYIRQTKHVHGELKNIVLAEDNGITWSEPALAAGAALHLSGWQNPYLCV